MASGVLIAVAVLVGVVLFARNARRRSDRRRRDEPRAPAGVRLFSTLIAFGSAAVLTQVALSWFDWSLGLAWLAAINVATVLWFGFDKLAAALGILRVPESTLHTMALFGGSAGAIIGQDMFQHKVSKQRFQNTLFVIVVVQIAVVLLYLRMASG